MLSIGSLINQYFRKQYIIPLLAFLIPLTVRSIPELLMGPYLVGFDTLAFYVPSILTWIYDGVNISQFLGGAPLFYIILLSLAALGVPILMALKVLPPLLLGCLALSMYTYANKGLKWSLLKSFFVALLGSLYFVALRVSWDQLRQELGLILLFFFLVMLMRYTKSRKNSASVILLSLLVVISHQLVSVLMFGILICMVLQRSVRRAVPDTVFLILSSLPSALFFILIYVPNSVPTGFQDYTNIFESSLASWLGFTSYPSMVLSEGGLFLYCFLPLLPLVLIGIMRFRNFPLQVWLVLSLILMLIPFAFVSPFRWIILLVYPLVFFVADSLTWLRRIKWRCYVFTLRRLAILYLILSTATISLGYILATPQQPFGYFNPQQINHYSYQIPTSMLQNTVSITDCQDTVNALQWFQANSNKNALLLTHSVFYSWALLSIDNCVIRNYGFGDPLHAAAAASKEGSSIYLIWWVNGQGWYNQTSLPSSFLEIYHSGKIAIYSYISS